MKKKITKKKFYSFDYFSQYNKNDDDDPMTKLAISNNITKIKENIIKEKKEVEVDDKTKNNNDEELNNIIVDADKLKIIDKSP